MSELNTTWCLETCGQFQELGNHMVSLQFPKIAFAKVLESETSACLTMVRKFSKQEASADWLVSHQMCLIFICLAVGSWAGGKQSATTPPPKTQ